MNVDAYVYVYVCKKLFSRVHRIKLIMDKEVLCSVCDEKTKYSCCSCGESVCNRPSCSDPVDELDSRYNEEEFCISKCKNDCLKRKHEEATVVSTVITKKKKVSFMSDYF